jgi:flagellar basal body-associated protein FliL
MLVLLVIAVVVVVAVLGAGVAVLVYFLTRPKNGGEKNPHEPRSKQPPPRQMPDNPPSP